MTTHCRRRILAAFAATAVWAAVTVPAAWADGGDRVPGFVDGQAFLDLADTEDELVEITLHGSLLKSLTQIDEELAALAGGLERIHAVILELSAPEAERKARTLLERTEKSLRGKGWEIIARVRESGNELKVLILNDEEKIRGLVVMGIDGDDRKLIFTNVAGVLDLAAIKRVGGELSIPGLEDLDYADTQ